MKIWLLEIGEPLPIEKDVRLHRYGMMSAHLAALGHDVTWWTSSYSHFTKGHLVEQDTVVTVAGVRLRILRGPGYGRNVSVARFRHQADFARRFLIESEKCEKPNVILAPVPTIEGAYAAVTYGLKNNVPVVVDVRDQWPDEFVDLSPKPLRPVAKLVLRSYFKKMKFLCENAAAIIGVSKSYRDYGLQFAGRAATRWDTMVPLGYSRKTCDPQKVAEAKAWWLAQGIDPNAFIVCFFGTIGKFFDLKTVIAAARGLQNQAKVQFVLCGHGSRLDEFKRDAKDVPSVFFPGWVDAPRINALMAMAKAGLAPYAVGTRMSLPNKPFEYLAGGLPVISSIQGEFNDLIEENGCGVTYRADSAQELTAIILNLMADPAKRSEMVLRSQELFQTRFDVQSIFSTLNQQLIQLVEDYKDRGHPVTAKAL
jgi:glycosyltransferase involved in cell wall biosynthesis